MPCRCTNTCTRHRTTLAGASSCFRLLIGDLAQSNCMCLLYKKILFPQDLVLAYLHPDSVQVCIHNYVCTLLLIRGYKVCRSVNKEVIKLFRIHGVYEALCRDTLLYTMKRKQCCTNLIFALKTWWVGHELLLIFF